MTSFINKARRTMKSVTTHVQPTETRRDIPHLPHDHFGELVLGQRAVHEANGKIIPESLKESYRRVIYTMPIQIITFPTPLQVRDFLGIIKAPAK